MRFYSQPHRFYCGIDLHARTMYLCILDHDGNIVFDHNLACNPKAFLHAIAPFRDGIVVGVECMFGRYWVAGLCCGSAFPHRESECEVLAPRLPARRADY
jgi:hypothetical protein